MPELPEVETVVRSLRQDVIGKRILNIKNSWPRHLASLDLGQMRERLIGSSITGINRRGKYIVFGLDSGDTMIIHLKMTGQLLFMTAPSAVMDHVHTTFQLSGDDELLFRDVRKFGRVYLTQDPNEILGQLGPEPLSESFTPVLLNGMLSERRRVLKPLLLDQHFIAGIGNIYADESLFLAKLAPTRISNTISENEGNRLYSSIRETLQLAVDNGGATISDYRRPDRSEGKMQNSFKVYSRVGQPCRRCDGVIERIVLGGRSTFFCGSCQA